MFDNKTILVTGGTGSFGKRFTSIILKRYPKLKKLIIFSRDELKQFHMSQEIDKKYHHKMRFFLGDVRDKDRLMTSLNGVDYVIHAAALKQVPTAEYNPFEFIKTNVLGAQNLIEACMANKVKKVIALSTDKAAAPLNLYGATKLCSDKLFVSANNITGANKITFSVVRYGNVMMSRGSVIPKFMDKIKENKIIGITHTEMTRFNITLEEGVNFVIFTLIKSIGGEIFIPKLSSFKIIDLLKCFQKKVKHKITGIRPGEKIHEEMITTSDSHNTIETKKFYIILPAGGKSPSTYIKSFSAKKVKKVFSYNSKDNPNYLSVQQLKIVINNENKFLKKN
ncbi:UDP-N-acetylglucosamine 4,6-dehydratase (inverting) [Candidatus Pelagibacter sp.]|nr:UDP-N-acetylglucosamine 4,6-dehydratase (inverting) [Candidatus Pelagibacter sp.]